MALIGALAENQRRNERLDRGLITVPSSGVATIVLGPMANASATFVLANPPGEIGGMRFLTHFELCFDTTVPAATCAYVVGSINSTGQTVGSITYPAGTVLNVKTYGSTFAAATTAANVRFTVWGMLQPNQF